MTSWSRDHRWLTLTLTFLLAFGSMITASVMPADAAAETVTLKTGDIQYYGTGSAGTHVRWVTHINGEPVDLDEIPGVSRSYAYCVQPYRLTPPEDTYKVTVIDDLDSGKAAVMRKMIYYLPGAYGYKKVTKSRWFGDNNKTGFKDYPIGHMALSYIYENYADSGRIWNGVDSKVKTKVKAMVDDLSKLPDPPASFEVFWVRVDGYQDTLGAFYSTEYGKANVQKSSSIPVTTEGNACYTLEGALYTLYTDSACTQIAKTSSGADAVIRVKADGSSDPIEVETGSYYIKETASPRGYALNTDIGCITVRTEETTTYVTSDVPKTNPVEILIQKLDKETGLAKPQGSASLEGAEYTIKYYDVTPSAGMSSEQMAAAVSDRMPAKISGADAVWVYKTDADGRIYMNDPDKYLVKDKSAPLYRDSSGRAVLPIGIISVRETCTPIGYEIDRNTYYRAITESGGGETLQTFVPLTDDDSLRDQVYRGDISFTKSAEGRKRMSGVLFRFTSVTTGESHILVTDHNGFASTASNWNAHDHATNAGKSPRDGVWFNGYNDEKTGAAPNNELGALPYDTYKMEELRCEANKGYDLISDVVTIDRSRVILDLGTFDDKKIPDEPGQPDQPDKPAIETRARDGETGSQKSRADDSITIIDEIEYSGVTAGRQYTMEGKLMDKATGKPLLDDNGREITSSTSFRSSSASGSAEVVFELSGASLGGKQAVVYEYMKRDGEVIATHADINNKKQTIKIVGTKAAGAPQTGDDLMPLLAYMALMAGAGEALVLTLKRRNDRLN